MTASRPLSFAIVLAVLLSLLGAAVSTAQSVTLPAHSLAAPPDAARASPKPASVLNRWTE